MLSKCPNLNQVLRRCKNPVVCPNINNKINININVIFNIYINRNTDDVAKLFGWKVAATWHAWEAS